MYPRDGVEGENMTIHYSLLVTVPRISEQHGWALDDLREVQLATQLAADAENWLAQFEWVIKTRSTLVGYAIPGVVGVFLIEIDPSDSSIDRELWVIVGDLPPAYISPDFASTPDEALNCYIAEMQAWVDAVIAGESTDDLIPVDATPDESNARMLQQRLDLLRTRVLNVGKKQ